jgi:glutamate racemase
LIERYVLPLLAQRADTIVLGCTHYPFLASLIREIAGPSVAIIDPAAAIARELRRRLASINQLSPEASVGTERFWTSAVPEKTKQVISQLWQMDVEVQALPNSAPAQSTQALVE